MDLDDDEGPVPPSSKAPSTRGVDWEDMESSLHSDASFSELDEYKQLVIRAIVEPMPDYCFVEEVLFSKTPCLELTCSRVDDLSRDLGGHGVFFVEGHHCMT